MKGDLKAIFDSSLFLLPLFLPQTVLLIVFSIYKELSPLIVTDAIRPHPFSLGGLPKALYNVSAL